MRENYQNSVKKILEEYAVTGVRESNKMESEQLVTYRAEIGNSDRSLVKKMDVKVNGKYEKIQIVVHLEKNIPAEKRPAILQLMNNLHKRWLYLRLYLTDDNDLEADYCTVIKKYDDVRYQTIFNDNIRAMFGYTENVIMEYAVAIEKVLEDTSVSKGGLTPERLCLNPFQNISQACRPAQKKHTKTGEEEYDRVILGENAVFSTDCSETQLNNNILVCGSSGSGKTMSISEPRLLYTHHSSLIMTLSKRKLIARYSRLFGSRGYQVWDLNFASPEESGISYDPLQYLKSWIDVTYLAEAIVMADSRKSDSKADPYWDQTAISLLSALISYVLMTKERGSMADVIQLFQDLKISPDDGLITTTIDSNFELLRKADPHCFAVSCWDSFRQTPTRTSNCIYSTLGAMLDKVFTPQLCKMMKQAEKIDFQELSHEKTLLFVTTSPVNAALNTFANIFYSQMFKELFEIGEANENGRLDRPVHVLCDDFACGAKILNFAEYISIFREKGISVTMMLQSESQLEAIYGRGDATTIINNSDTYIYLGGIDLQTAKSVSQRVNKPLEDVLYMPVGKEYIFRRGQRPIATARYDILGDLEYQELMQAEREAAKKESEQKVADLEIDGADMELDDMELDDIEFDEEDFEWDIDDLLAG